MDYSVGWCGQLRVNRVYGKHVFCVTLKAGWLSCKGREKAQQSIYSSEEKSCWICSLRKILVLQYIPRLLSIVLATLY